MAFSAKPIENGDAISKYATFYMPKYGMFYGIVMDISQQTTFCLSFNTVSSEELSKLKKNLVIWFYSQKCFGCLYNEFFFFDKIGPNFVADGGNKKCNRTWNLIVFRLNEKMEPLLNEPMASLPIQVMAEQRWSKNTKRTHNEENESSTIQSFLEWAENHPNISENKKLKMVDLLRKKQWYS